MAPGFARITHPIRFVIICQKGTAKVEDLDLQQQMACTLPCPSVICLLDKSDWALTNRYSLSYDG